MHFINMLFHIHFTDMLFHILWTHTNQTLCMLRVMTCEAAIHMCVTHDPGYLIHEDWALHTDKNALTFYVCNAGGLIWSWYWRQTTPSCTTDYKNGEALIVLCSIKMCFVWLSSARAPELRWSGPHWCMPFDHDKMLTKSCCENCLPTYYCSIVCYSSSNIAVASML